jgi:phytoene desaturase
MNKRKAVIIGGGLGGIAVALRLAARGWQVTVCERGATFGGKMNVWSERGFQFDTGPSLITMPWILGELFEVAGERLEEHLELVRIEPVSEYVFDDGTRFTYSSSMPEWIQTLRQLDRRDEQGFFKFMTLGAQLYEVSKETFLSRPPFAKPNLRSLAAMRHMPLRYGWGNYHETVAAHFKSPHLIQLFDRYPTYVGSSPYRSPATLAVIPYIEYSFGGWYVKGGLYRVIESLTGIARRAGVRLLTGAQVEGIETRDGAARGVRLKGGIWLTCDAVIMNGDASKTAELLGEAGATGLPERERSLSGLIFLLGVGRGLDGLHHHSIYFSSDYAQESRQLFDERRFPDDPTVYVNAPSRTDRSVVPGEGEALFVMANAPADADGWTETDVAEARRRVFDRLRKGGFPDIESDVVVSDVWTPRRMASQYMMPGGAIYGTHSHGWRRAFLRPPNKHRKVKGLYFVGGSTHPGGGTPTVLLSARITANLIEKHES